MLQKLSFLPPATAETTKLELESAIVKSANTFERHVESSELFRELLFWRLDYLHQMSVHECLFSFYYIPPFLAGSSQQHNAANHCGPVTVPPLLFTNSGRVL